MHERDALSKLPQVLPECHQHLLATSRQIALLLPAEAPKKLQHWQQTSTACRDAIKLHALGVDALTPRRSRVFEVPLRIRSRSPCAFSFSTRLSFCSTPGLAAHICMPQKAGAVKHLQDKRTVCGNASQAHLLLQSALSKWSTAQSVRRRYTATDAAGL